MWSRPALGDRPPLEQPNERHERRVEDRDREHEQRQHGVASVVPATFQLDASASEASAKPSTWLPESPMKTDAERPGRRLKGRKRDEREPEREREHEHHLGSGARVTASRA